MKNAKSDREPRSVYDQLNGQVLHIFMGLNAPEKCYELKLIYRCLSILFFKILI